MDGTIVSFIVEDKVGSSTHDDQLTRYRKLVAGDKIREDWIKAIYFKTGYVFEEERRHVEARKYSVFDLSALADFLRTKVAAVDNELVRQFRQHILGQDRRRHDNLQKLLEGRTEWDLDESRTEQERDSFRDRPYREWFYGDVVQHEFMLLFRKQLVMNPSWVALLDPDVAWGSPSQKGTYGRVSQRAWSRQEIPTVPQKAWTEIWHGTNRGGDPWTHLSFCGQLCWRVERFHPLRLMLNLWGFKHRGGRDRDRELWGQHRKSFADAMAHCDLEPDRVQFKFGNQCTIGAVRLDRENQTPLRVIERLPALQTEFLRRIRRVS